MAPSEDTKNHEQLLRDENDRLRTQLAELRTRLKEPEEIIRAIRYGEVDAFVITEPRGEKIYTIRSADILYRVMIEEMKEGAIALDPSGVVLYCNWHFATLMKAKREAITGAPIFAFVPDESRSFFDALRRHSVNGTSRQELTLRAGGGELVSVLIAMNRLRLEEQDVFCAIVTDLTEQKRQEELVTQARRKDEFLAMLAHELRNPIAPIRNAVEIMRLRNPADPELHWARDVIERQIIHLTRLVDDLLDVSRITLGRIKLELATVDLLQVIMRAIETARPLIDARQQELSLDLPAGPLLIKGDATRLAQVMSNLLNNASKFTTERGHIYITMEQHRQEVVIRVRDTGVGISPEILPRIFDLFAQADTSLERSQGGLGIGLTLVRKLTEMHGGSIAASSPGPGKGSEFTVRLPLLDENARTEANGVAASAPASTSYRVLVVDDNSDGANSLLMLLRHWGHEGRIALDGQTALQEARTFRPQFIILDIGLPGMNGYEVARKLRQMPELEKVVLVALTGYGQEEDRQRSAEAGFDLHWVKPVDPQQLEGLFSEAIRNRA